jgi:hypothetical protein
MLTDTVLNNDTFKYKRGYLDYPNRPIRYDKIDIFKYTLASYAVLPFSKVLIYCKLDTMYEHREAELQEFVAKEFSGQKFQLYFRRNEHQKDWQDVYRHQLNELNDDVVWFCCNHDHVFMDYNLDVWKSGEELLKQRTDPAAIYPSHWPELLNKASYIHNEKPGPTDTYDTHVGFQLLNNNDSIQIINKALYQRWWFEQDYGDAYLPRSDYRLADQNGNPIGYDIRNGRNRMLQHYCFVPLREQCRHYDGYGHVEINPNLCPAISIPPGFFDNNIKIKYGYSNYLPDCVNINPINLYNSSVDKNGTDYSWITSDVPLFWKNRISSIEDNSNSYYDIGCRDDKIYDVANCRMSMDNRMLRDQPWYDNFKNNNMKYIDDQD